MAKKVFKRDSDLAKRVRELEDKARELKLCIMTPGILYIGDDKNETYVNTVIGYVDLDTDEPCSQFPHICESKLTIWE